MTLNGQKCSKTARNPLGGGLTNPLTGF